MRYGTQTQVVVEAVQWTGDNERALREFLGPRLVFSDGRTLLVALNGLEQSMDPRQWVVRDADGHLGLWEPGRFAMIFTPMEATPPVTRGLEAELLRLNGFQPYWWSRVLTAVEGGTLAVEMAGVFFCQVASADWSFYLPTSLPAAEVRLRLVAAARVAEARAMVGG